MQVSTLRATARRSANFVHTISIRDHQLLTDETRAQGGEDEGPNPEELLAASLASCTAITIEMYAQRKGWDVGPVEVDVQYSPAERGCPTKFDLVLHLPAHLSDEQVANLRVIAAKCPIHRTLDGEVMFTERVERVNLTR
jgi:putative redox protein